MKNLTPFKKGQVSNPKGRPPKLPDLELLLGEVLGAEKNGKTAAQAILDALQAKAAKGDIRAAELLFNRGYGLAKQTIKHQGDPDAPVIFKTDERFTDHS